MKKWSGPLRPDGLKDLIRGLEGHERGEGQCEIFGTRPVSSFFTDVSE